MRISVFVTLLFLSVSTIYGQIKPKSQDWFSYDLTYGMLLNGPDGLSNEGVSNGHSFTLVKDFPFSTNFGVATGVGFHSDNYYSNLRITTNPANGTEDFQLINYDTINSNKLTSQYIHVPFEVRIRTSANDKGRFTRIYLGARVGVRVNSYAQYITDKINVSYNNLDALNRFDYGVYTRIGYHYFNVFAYYGLSPIIETGTVNTSNGNTANLDAIRTLSVGISFCL